MKKALPPAGVPQANQRRGKAPRAPALQESVGPGSRPEVWIRQVLVCLYAKSFDTSVRMDSDGNQGAKNG